MKGKVLTQEIRCSDASRRDKENLITTLRVPARVSSLRPSRIKLKCLTLSQGEFFGKRDVQMGG
jgi:hypothetical protein